jgi:hypothetical protein
MPDSGSGFTTGFIPNSSLVQIFRDGAAERASARQPFPADGFKKGRGKTTAREGKDRIT